MQFRRVEPNKTLALTRVNTLLGRVFSIAASLVGMQTLLNAITENQQHQLQPFWFWLNFCLITAAHLLIIFLVWIVGDGRFGFAALTLSTAFALATWAFQLDGGSLPAGMQPWIWWSVGIGAISSVGAFNVFWSAVFLIGFPTAWFFLQVSNIGARVDPWLAFQDASFVFLVSSVLAGFVFVLRYEAAKTDDANQKVVEAAIQLATADAITRERDRVDALVHDSVLTTLLVASTADGKAAQEEASLLADTAIEKLTTAQNAGSKQDQISVNSLFSALEVAIRRESHSAVVEIEGTTDTLVPNEVADAAAESALQALANAFHHAGKAAKIEVFLKGNAAGFKIVVKDNGRGFRPSRVPKNRLGLRLSIIGRMQAVGGKVFIDSKIGIGTNVIIEWTAK